MRRGRSNIITRFGAGTSLGLLAGPALADWRSWIGIEPKPEDTGLLAGLDWLHYLLLFIVLVVVIAALSRPTDLWRGFAEGIGQLLGGLTVWVGVAAGISAVATVAGMVAMGSYTFATAGIIFVCVFVAIHILILFLHAGQ